MKKVTFKVIEYKRRVDWDAHVDELIELGAEQFDDPEFVKITLGGEVVAHWSTGVSAPAGGVARLITGE